MKYEFNSIDHLVRRLGVHGRDVFDQLLERADLSTNVGNWRRGYGKPCARVGDQVAEHAWVRLRRGLRRAADILVHDDHRVPTSGCPRDESLLAHAVVIGLDVQRMVRATSPRVGAERVHHP